MKKQLLKTALFSALAISSMAALSAGTYPVRVVYDQYGNQIIQSVPYGSNDLDPLTSPVIGSGFVKPAQCPAIKANIYDPSTGYITIDKIDVLGVTYWATIRVDSSSLVAFGRN